MLLARRAGFWGCWAAAESLLVFLSVGTAAFIPGTSFLFLTPAVAAGLAALPCAWTLARARIPPGWAMDFAAVIPVLAIFTVTLPLLPLTYTALGSPAWPVSTLVLCVAATALLPLLAAAGRRSRRGFLAAAALTALGGTAVTFVLPTYSAEWPQRINFDYWLDADAGTAEWRAQTDSARLSPQIALAAAFEAVPRPDFAGDSPPAFHAPAPRFELAAPELTVASRPMVTAASTHYELRLTSPRGAPEAEVIFPASAKIDTVTVMTGAGSARARLHRLGNGATRLDVVGLPPEGAGFGVDAAGTAPLTVRLFDRSHGLERGKFLQSTRPREAASSQDGDLTVVHRTVSLDPAAGR